MDPYAMDLFSAGAITLGYAVAGLFFLRFWRDTRDRLFLLFALAFFVLSANRVGAAWLGSPAEPPGYHVYWIRFAAFALILVAIIDKNRQRGPV
jgi:hypothetical protein